MEFTLYFFDLFHIFIINILLVRSLSIKYIEVNAKTLFTALSCSIGCRGEDHRKANLKILR